MDEYEPTVMKPDLTAPSGDVDDLIFDQFPDWYASDR